MQEALQPFGFRKHLHWDETHVPAYLAALAAAYFIAAYLVILFFTLDYPHQMEWLEGATLQTVQRVSEGRPIYAAPTLAYTPFMYTPLYYYAAAGMSLITGQVDLLAGRIVSLLGTLLLAAVFYFWLRREGASRWLALLPVALYAATYGASGNWFHVARVDSLFLGLTLAGLFAFISFHGKWSAMLAGLLLSLAAATKQQALMMALPVLALGLFAWPKRSLITLAVMLALLAPALLALQYRSGGWLWYYIWELPRLLPKITYTFLPFWREDLLGKMPVLFALAIAAVAMAAERDWRKGLVLLGLLAGAVAASLGLRMHFGGWLNVLMPVYAACCLLSVMAVRQALSMGTMHRNFAWLLLFAQFALLAYNPLAKIPKPNQIKAGYDYLHAIKKYPGDIFIPDMQFMQERVGKRSYAWRMGGIDIMYAYVPGYLDARQALKDELERSLKEKRFSAIFLAGRNDLPEKNPYYRFKETLPGGSTLLTGVRFMPVHVFVPK